MLIYFGGVYNPIMEEISIHEHLRNFAVCGLISGILTCVFAATHFAGYNYYNFIDAALVLALTGFAFILKSRTASTLMVAYWLMNILLSLDGHINYYALIVRAAFLFFFIMGMMATYQYHKKVLHEKGPAMSYMTRRVIAAFLELFLIPFAAYLVVNVMPDLSLEANRSVWQLGYFFFALSCWLAAAIYILFKDAMFQGQSFAKRALGLRVVDAYSRVKCRWWQSLVRNIVFFVPFAQLIELIVVFTNSERRRIGDFLARTKVVDAGEEFKPKPEPKKKHVEYLMKIVTVLLAAVFVVVIFFFALRYFNERNISDRIKSSDESVVTIWTYDNQDRLIGFGSGFFINSSGVALTNRHVIAGAYKAFAMFRQKELVVESVINSDAEKDIAILQVRATNTPFLRLGNSDDLKMGDDIYTIGSPIGLQGTVSKGIISQIRYYLGIKLLQTDAAISPGSSGGPMLNRDLQVVGINVAFMREGENLNFAVPINYATILLDRSKVKYSK